MSLPALSRLFTRPAEGREDILAGPIHGDLLGAEGLAERARTLAGEQRIAGAKGGPRRTPLLSRLDASHRILDAAHDRLADAADAEVDVTPAGEWLLDNYHVVQEHIREVRESLPRGYYRELPDLAGGGALAGYPRVYELAITLISHSEGRIAQDNLNLFTSAFQEVTPLTIGEIWAVPAMLRLGLIESVRRMALRTVHRLDEVEAADTAAARILAAGELGSAALRAALDDFLAAPPELTPGFVSRFLAQLRLTRGAFPPLVSLEQWIAEEGLSAEEAGARSARRLALTQLTMANSITSLRIVGRLDWRGFVERQSIMEAALQQDPSGFYPRMTFATRDRYRHVVERIAKRTGLPERAVVERAVELARAAGPAPTGNGAAGPGAAGPAPLDQATGGDAVAPGRRDHVGYFLVDDGLAELERGVGYRPAPREAVYRWVLRHPNVIFGGGVVVGTLLALAPVFWVAGPATRGAWLAVLLFALIPANDIAVSIVNQLVTAFLPPRTLPKLDLSDGVPQEYRTAVVVPILFGSLEAVHEALENLEVQFLANREAHLHFAILSDFTDSPTESREGDAAIVQAAVGLVRELNERYAPATGDAFYLLHRPRRWNPRQGVWMGWERKRGKLAEFNHFVRGGAEGSFSVVEGNLEPLRRVRYVITLDADTRLPPSAAPLLVGTLAHPLNRAVYDPASGRVVRGYGILQPRVGVSLPSAHRSRFAAIHSGHPGVDPYTTAVSDVYQDLYGEGSFTGKGIYDLDAFERATAGRFPENTLLSHDLIEGNYARAGLATDVIVYDDYPSRYLTYTRRKHRWIRGDWQLLRWLTRWVPGPDGRERNRLSLLSRWKILDNLRRSTLEIAELAFLVAGWTVLPGSPLSWTLLGIGAIAAPWMVSLLLAVLRPPLDKSWRAYYAAVGRDAVTGLQQVGLALVFLPHQAWVSGDAIGRTLWRLLVTRRHLLEWQTASHAERVAGGGVRPVWRAMGPALALATLILVVVLARGLSGPPARLWEFAVAVLPLVGIWIASPVIAHALSAPLKPREHRLARPRREQAMRYALLHWRFFERFVTEETNWLAPDNFQEVPSPVVAMRTSPTNIGLQLLATVSAYDLGFVTVEEMTRKLELALRSLERMRRYRGHLYNWYDLHELQPMEPAYISTVDSGNLAGHLIALRQACLTIPDEPVYDARAGRALDSALGLAGSAVRELLSPADEAVAPSPALTEVTRTAWNRVRAARVAVPGAAWLFSPSALPTLAAPLTRAAETLAAGGLERAAEAPASGWIARALRLAEEHADWQARLAGGPAGEPRAGAAGTLRSLAPTSPAAADLVRRLEAIAGRAHDLAMEMDFRFLFDRERKLFAIGYQLTGQSLDGSYYDLLASEARLASFVAVAKDDVPVDHWFRLGRTLTRAAGETALVSWSGSMFEYLMPVLVMESLPSTVLDQTYRAALRRHIAYGVERGVPWGVSESAYNLRDRHLTYQYRAFGVPDLALKRGLGHDLVVAPYASALALLVDPTRALANLAALEKQGTLGPYGFRDAVDYTRPQPGERYAVVQTYMAHHIGMAFVALTNALRGQVWQQRFHADPLVRSAELLLHERIPRRLVLQEPQPARADEAFPDPELERPAVREIDDPDTPAPRVALLGHTPYTIMVTSVGGGYSRYEDLAVTRWRADGTRDDTGQFCYIKDVTRGRTWSAAHQPVCAPADRYRGMLATDRVTFQRQDGDISTRTEIAVVAGDAAEVRRVIVTNHGSATREIELTSYGEVVLAPPDAERAHPAFANLFVETEYHAWCTAVTATRRPRSAKERPRWCVHVVAAGRERVGSVTCETDRARFVGRGRSTRDPVALERDGGLSGTTGAVLDPIFALRTRVRLTPGQSASVAFTTAVAETREQAFELADRYQDPHAAQRALDLAWTSTQVELRSLGIAPAEASVFQDLAGHLFFGDPAFRAPQEELARNRGSQPLLWAYGVSGDWPIVLATIDAAEGLPTLRQLLSAHLYWRRRGMMVDLVVLNAHRSGYFQELHEKIQAAVYAAEGQGSIDRPGGVFLRRLELARADELLMLRATARLHVTCDGRALGRLLETPAPPAAAGNGAPPWWRLRRTAVTPLRTEPRRPRALPDPASPAAAGAARRADDLPLVFDNGFGGLTGGGEYQIRVAGDRVPPAPWANVIANPSAGFVVTERGAGFTWARNSYFFRLTPWHNDPVGDPAGEAIYLRDEETGELWSATPAPAGRGIAFTVRHGVGASSFNHFHAGIAARLTLGLAGDAPIKLAVLRLTNRDERTRRLTVTAYAEWALGVLREHTQHQVRTVFDGASGATFAQNFFDPQFADQVAFHAISEPVTAHTGDRREFLGRNGSPSAPAALVQPAAGSGPSLAGTAFAGANGAGLDPCSALQCSLTLGPGEARDIVVLLGASAGEAEARDAVAEYRVPARARAALDGATETWDRRLRAITVRTPDPSFDVMLNRWALYQTLACRLWGRSALYQSSGAYGFRDQLQDVMALLYAEPALAREHILRSAARQFPEGDVQHWWHPQSGRGVRTKFSDDLAWLPFVVDHYLRVTADRSVLDESVPFITMRELGPDEHEVYDRPAVTEQRDSVYGHCVRALRRACTSGVHGLPLIGIGDWNDGMNRVGVEGRGESVWLAWFLIATCRAFADHAQARGDASEAAELRSQAERYAAAVERGAWDGEWYRRAYFDDGTPLGSAESEECRIDSIAQSWSVISGAGDPARQAQAMRSLEDRLVDREARLLMLLTPPFDKTPHDPGYIKGYLPGVRENGAQYTHAALWAVLATALRGEGDRAFELFQMINPLTHARTLDEVETYKVEPYVVAADVYTAKGQLGRGGWTWYTGSASWLYRVGLEAILGFTKRGDTLSIRPRVPADWPEFTIEYRHGSSVYAITVQDPARLGDRAELLLDGERVERGSLPLVDDGERHEVLLRPAATPG